MPKTRTSRLPLSQNSMAIQSRTSDRCDRSEYDGRPLVAPANAYVIWRTMCGWSSADMMAASVGVPFRSPESATSLAIFTATGDSSNTPLYTRAKDPACSKASRQVQSRQGQEDTFGGFYHGVKLRIALVSMWKPSLMKRRTLLLQDSTAYKLADAWLTGAQKVPKTQALNGNMRFALVAEPRGLQEHEEDVPAVTLPCFRAGATGNSDGQCCIVHGVRVCRPAKHGRYKNKHSSNQVGF